MSKAKGWGRTDCIKDGRNNANKKENAVKRRSTTSNGDEKVTDDQRCVHNCKGGRCMVLNKTFASVDNQSDGRS